MNVNKITIEQSIKNAREGKLIDLRTTKPKLIDIDKYTEEKELNEEFISAKKEEIF